MLFKDADATVISGVCSSDARFKKDITAFTDVLGPLTARGDACLERVVLRLELLHRLNCEYSSDR